MVTKGDRIALKKEMGILKNIGEVFIVNKVEDDGAVWFSIDNDNYFMGCVSADDFDKYFEKYKEPEKEAEIVDIDDVAYDETLEIMEDLTVIDKVKTGKCFAVTVLLPNDYILTETYTVNGYVDDDLAEDEYEGIYDIIMERIENKVYEFEKYKLLSEFHESKEREDIDDFGTHYNPPMPSCDEDKETEDEEECGEQCFGCPFKSECWADED